MTVEAALVLPIFLFFFLNLGCVLEMLRLHGNLEAALQKAGSGLSVYGAMLTDPLMEAGPPGHGGRKTPEAEGTDEDGGSLVGEIGDLLVTEVYVRKTILEELGENYLDTSPLPKGASSILFLESELFGDGDILDLKATYPVEPIFPGPFFSFRMTNRYYAHLWNGYAVTGDAAGLSQDKIVYITADSEVYHVTTSCTHLKLSVAFIGWEDLEDARNAGGARYYPCDYCAKGERPPDGIYIAREGNRYHYTSGCQALTRTYTAVPLSEVEDSHRPCSRCGK